MATFTSTIPGAVSTLQGYMNTVAAATTVSDVGVYVGYSVRREGMAHNYLMVGNYDGGIPVLAVESNWNAIPGQSLLRSESYALEGHVRTWAGGQDYQSRLNDAFALLNALQDQIFADLGGSGTLTPPGSWGGFNWRVEEFGPLGDPKGWGVVIGFELHVINAQLSG